MSGQSESPLVEQVAEALFNEAERGARSFVKWAEGVPDWRREHFERQADAVLDALRACPRHLIEEGLHR
jgi:hypothetical protein